MNVRCWPLQTNWPSAATKENAGGVWSNKCGSAKITLPGEPQLK